MTFAFSVFDFLAASRTNPAIKDAGMAVGLGLFVALLSVALIYFGAKKRGQTMDKAFYQKLVMYGFTGLLCGYFSMRITIRNNPELFREKPPLSDLQIQNITNNPLPQMQQPRLSDPLNQNSRSQSAPAVRSSEQEVKLRRQAEERQAEHEARLQKQREESERRSQEMREQHEARVAKMNEEREARRAQQQAEREAAQASEAARKQEDINYLQALSLDELRKARDEREKEKNDATAALRAANARDSGATPEERKAASKRFSAAIGAYMEATKVLLEKERQQRELNR